ncbi:MAG TPA: M28 family peptidase [Haliangiales bacterium]|nr:M28 family peptidase [Haliangiales bacterium]
MRRAALALALSIPVLARADDAAVRLVGRALGDTPMLADLRQLTDEIGGRPTGSPANDRAVDWGVAKFRAAGLEVKTETAPVPQLWLGGAARAACVKPEPFALAVSAAPGSASALGLEARLVDAGDGTKMSAGARGAIALVGIGEMRSLDDLFAEYMRTPALVAAATKAGIVALLLESSHPRDLLYRHPVAFSRALPFPVAIISREHAARLRRLAAAGEVRVRLDLDNKIGPAFTTRNVVADLRGREKPDEIVVLGAHLDSWDLGTGANDNGVNAALVIDVARGMKALGLTPRRTVRFVLWNGEEQGLWGSAGYVRAHAAEMDKHVATVTFDIGSGRTLGFFLNGRPELRAVVDEALRPVAGLGPFAHIDEAVDGTDNFDFLLSGVPNFVANQDAAPYLPDYHASSDTFDKVDPREAQANAAIASALVWALAERAEPPGKRQTRAEVEKLIRATKLEPQMKAFDQWDDWVAKKRGASK